MNYYAKAFGGQYQTLQEHTEKLLENFEILKRHVNLDKDLEQALYLSCLFHDIGKASREFQEKITKQKLSSNKEIPHNLLSTTVFYCLRKHFKDKHLFDKILYAIAYHHDRDKIKSTNKVGEVLKDFGTRVDADLKDWLLEKLQACDIAELNIDQTRLLSGLNVAKDLKHKMENEFKKDKQAILIKGFLHRLDHAASAGVEVEKGLIQDYQNKLLAGLSKKGINGLKDFQKKALDYKDKSIILTASTGMGKTEFALNWVAGSKAFYTLPLRAAVNAMYERISNIFGKDNVGILHADTMNVYFKELKDLEDTGIEVLINQVQSVRQLSMPITVSTADQIFLASLKYPGFEKIYATLTYSKVIVDEPQAYSPGTLAIIIEGLSEISDLGGKFCLMSATMHPLVRKYLKDKAEILEPEFHQEQKHRIKLVNETIDEIVQFAIDEYKKGKKVLMLTNTVRKAQEVYKLIKEQNEQVKVNLLHSLYINKTKAEKERQIQNETEPVIWVSTQIVEASLDIDYDLLITELSTADSLIQRMGRVYRKIGRVITQDSEPNVIICTEYSGNSKIYDKDIVDYTLEELEKYNECILTEEIKQNIIDNVFYTEKIKGTDFYKQFKNNMNLLNAGFTAENKTQAQNLFRDIANLSVIPKIVYNENSQYIQTLIEKINSKNKLERLQAIQELNDLSVSAQFYRLQGKDMIKLDKGIFVADIRYNEELGFDLTSEDLVL